MKKKNLPYKLTKAEKANVPPVPQKIKIECQCCSDYLTIYPGPAQVIFDMQVTEWDFWRRVKYAFNIIFRWHTGKYSGGGTIWITPDRLQVLIDQLKFYE